MAPPAPQARPYLYRRAPVPSPLFAFALSPPQTTPPPNPLYPRHGSTNNLYTPPPGALSSAATWSGRPSGEWDLPYFPLWNESAKCENTCLWGGAHAVDNQLLCQNNTPCMCQPEKLSTGVVWASKCVEKRCDGGRTWREGSEYVQTVMVEYCGNAWRVKEMNVTGPEDGVDGFVVPRTGALVDSIVVDDWIPETTGGDTITPTSSTFQTAIPSSDPTGTSSSSSETRGRERWRGVH
ncbi:hypothetical protein BDZ91DRAFT_492496 [Kalaharituber pfeilii]|nr:hypothetical protein BDZ91DRAFT_492496 [Kalaharituber pfeilii]